MKKLLISLFLMFLCFGAYSQSIKRESGSLMFLKSAKVVGVTFTYDNMKVGKLTEEEYVSKSMGRLNKKETGRGDRWKEAWIRDRSERYEPKFLEFFSKFIGEKGVSVTTSDYEYEIMVNVDFIEPGFNLGIAGDAVVNMTCRIINKDDGSEVAIITVKNAKYSSSIDPTVGSRVQEAFSLAGRALAKFMIKDAKL